MKKSEPLQKLNKWAKVGKVAAIFFTFLLVIIGLAYARTDVGTAAANYDKNLTAAKAAGLCFTSADVARHYKVPDDENGALLTGELVKTVEALNKKYDYSTTISDQDFLVYWKELEPCLPALRIAVDKPHFIFKRKLNTPWFSTQDTGAIATFVSRAMRRVKIAALSGQKEVAFDLLTICTKLAVHLGEEPSIDAVYRRKAASGFVEKSICDLIPRFGKDKEWQSLSLNILTLLDKPYDLNTAIRCEHWSEYTAAEILMGHGDTKELGLGNDDAIRPATTLSKFIPRFKAANISRLNQLNAELVAQLPNDLRDLTSTTKALQDFENKVVDPEILNLSYKFMQDLGSQFSYLGINLEEDFAKQNTLRQALWLLKSGTDPAKGLPISGRFTRDIGGGKILLDHMPKGWVVYSVGKNGKDQHTTPPPAYIDDFIVHLTMATVPPELPMTKTSLKLREAPKKSSSE
ncbi:MAG: hypothetical protein WCG75_12165 [Armatimonadota bacterium]